MSLLLFVVDKITIHPTTDKCKSGYVNIGQNGHFLNVINLTSGTSKFLRELQGAVLKHAQVY